MRLFRFRYADNTCSMWYDLATFTIQEMIDFCKDNGNYQLEYAEIYK